MKICPAHWQMMRQALTDAGLDPLVAKSGQEAVEAVISEAQGDEFPFDPLMSMNWHYWTHALKYGGLYLMNIDAEVNPHNEGHYCPLCEFVKHASDFDAQIDITHIASQMRVYAIGEKLIPGNQ